MAENSAISWTDHTFNPWIGCTRISPACDGCYAAGLMGLPGPFGPARVTWGGPGVGEGTHSRTAESTWKGPRRWNRKAAAEPGKTFVFCASLADVFDNAVPTEWRRDLFDLIRATPHLTWLLLTKRPGNIRPLFLASRRHDEAGELIEAYWPRNAAIGCTVVTQEEADRDVPKLLAAKAALNPAFAFLSMEPLLGPVDLTRLDLGVKETASYGPKRVYWDALTGWEHQTQPDRTLRAGEFGRTSSSGPERRLDWVITGGETDQRTEAGMHRARPADPAWFRSLRDQCAAAGVPFHFKQWGEWQPGFIDGDKPIWRFGNEEVCKNGKDRDPCTLDGVKHLARPEVAS